MLQTWISLFLVGSGSYDSVNDAVDLNGNENYVNDDDGHGDNDSNEVYDDEDGNSDHGVYDELW